MWSASESQAGPERLLDLLQSSVAVSRAAVVVDTDEGLRVALARPATACPEALTLASRALLVGSCQQQGRRLALPGKRSAVLWVERADRELTQLEHAFCSALMSAWSALADDVQGAPSHPTATEQGLFVGRSHSLLQALTVMRKIATSSLGVFVGGESGTGKELAARELHRLSGREGSFVALNCAAIPAELFESELFGHLKGAFSGAESERQGAFEQAAGGTLFLDEVGELAVACQAKLLRALGRRAEFRRVGDNRVRQVDVRVVCASNLDLDTEVKAGRFRRDLFFRLVESQLELPPLRERAGDLELLLRFFIKRSAQELGVVELGLAPRTLELLHAHAWPGNVRELEGLVRSLSVTSAGRPAEPEDLPRWMRALGAVAPASLQEARERAERVAILGALESTIVPGRRWPTVSATSSDGRAITSPDLRGFLFLLLRRQLLQRALDRPQGGAGDLAVARGGIEFLVAQEHLDHADVDLLLQQVGREAVPERVQRDRLIDAGRHLGAIKGASQLARGQRIDRVLAREQPALRP